MKTPKYYLLSILLLSCYLSGFSQADISMTTHWYDRANYNPAFIARTDYLYLFTNVRTQWVGIDGAPTVMNLQASEYIHSMNSAFGVSLISDQIGITNVLNPSFQYAYRIAPNSEEWALSLGLSAGLFARTINGSLFDPVSLNDDPALVYDNRTIYRPDSNFGVEFQGKYLYIGLSLTHLFAIGKSDNTFENTSHHYGYVIYKNANSDYFNFSTGIEVVNRINLYDYP
jgi:type IX secretion system PorP/SprF family membrane protein